VGECGERITRMAGVQLLRSPCPQDDNDEKLKT
jgi:hypothetical protein